MSTLYILIDSSTDKTKENNRIVSNCGKASAFWCAYRDEIEGIPCRAGFTYNDYLGPNKIFFDGVIRALEACYYMVQGDCELKVLGDCVPVLKILKRENQARKLKPFFNQTKELERRYKEERGYNIDINYEYINEENRIYKKVDECASQFKNNLIQKFHQD